MSTKPYQGSCLCGAVKYSVDAIGSRMGHCHCHMCRKFHGAAFATFGEAKSADFRWLQGEDQLKCYRAENATKRYFCGICGSSMAFQPSDCDGSLVEFSLATLDSDIPHRPDAHIFTDYAASWTDISDGLVQYRENRDGAIVSGEG